MTTSSKTEEHLEENKFMASNCKTEKECDDYEQSDPDKCYSPMCDCIVKCDSYSVSYVCSNKFCDDDLPICSQNRVDLIEDKSEKYLEVEAAFKALGYIDVPVVCIQPGIEYEFTLSGLITGSLLYLVGADNCYQDRPWRYSLTMALSQPWWEFYGGYYVSAFDALKTCLKHAQKSATAQEDYIALHKKVLWPPSAI